MFVSDISDEEIKKRVSNFKRQAERGISDEACVNALSSIFGNTFSFPVEMKSYEQGRIFYRVRALPPSDTKIPLKTIQRIEDAWEPPAQFVNVQGRLNKANQGILYCCPDDIELAIDEARARSSKHIAAIVYKSSRKINVAVLGDYENSSLPKDDRSNFFYSFLNEEFSRFVPAGSEGSYSITRAIADSYFNYPEQDAWCYRSVQSRSKFNVAFLPGKSKSCLNLVGIMICEMGASAKDTLKVKVVVDFDENSGEARYHAIGSQEQVKIFPEIRRM
ncbi:RES domain-containing protein [Castellaniella ginsengisoli]|uniref:RES domain-containing protein n=1 Tax=Castellaniella ginsengisoli TaxID=546114 RepID=A0AB39EEM9_9BURK